eukprot:1485706-Rhodomonas_salina.3
MSSSRPISAVQGSRSRWVGVSVVEVDCWVWFPPVFLASRAYTWRGVLLRWRVVLPPAVQHRARH